MMNAADAISAADSTLRPGRNAALRKPSRGDRPGAAAGDRGAHRDRSHDDRTSNEATQQRRAGAEERTGLVPALNPTRDQRDGEDREAKRQTPVPPRPAGV